MFLFLLRNNIQDCLPRTFYSFPIERTLCYSYVNTEDICNLRLCMVNYIILYKKFVEHHVIKLILLKISKLSAHLTHNLEKERMQCALHVFSKGGIFNITFVYFYMSHNEGKSKLLRIFQK